MGGLGQDALRAAYPRLIHCRISGFGADGPLGGLPGYDACAQAMCGLMSVNGERGGEPTRIGLPAVDMVTGLNAVIGIAFALLERERSGQGQFVEATLYDCATSLLHPHAANYFLSGAVPGRTGNAHPNIAPYETFPTGNGTIFLAVGNDRQFRQLTRVLGDEGIADDPEFATNALRLQNRERMRIVLSQCLVGHDAELLSRTLLDRGVPAAAISDVGQVLSHPHTLHRGMVVEANGYRGLGPPVKLSRTPATIRRAPPKLDEHAAEIGEEYGF